MSPSIVELDPVRIDAVLFDLDGVLVDTIGMHEQAWGEVCGTCIARHGKGELTPFDRDRDFAQTLNGLSTVEGARAFLESRGILPEDPRTAAQLIAEVARCKDQRYAELRAQRGLAVDPAAPELLRRLRTAGVVLGVVTSSSAGRRLLEEAELAGAFEAVVDATLIAKLGLTGKPAPDSFLEAARRLGVPPRRTAVVEDAPPGVDAARRGGFAVVIGVGRGANAAVLRERGARAVVRDLSELSVPPVRSSTDLPRALESWSEIRERCGARRPALFIDYDGTLTPIVSRPEEAVLAESMRRLIRKLATRCPVAIISGRDRTQLEGLVRVREVFYVGSHGFEIAGPAGLHHDLGTAFLPALDAAEGELRDRLRGIEGAQVERKRFTVAVHERRVRPEDLPGVEAAVAAVLHAHLDLQREEGKAVIEMQPRLEWNKGKATRWLWNDLRRTAPETIPVYIGDDFTDETAFRELQEDGVAILVGGSGRRTAAQYTLADPDEVAEWIHDLLAFLS